ncbi:MAG TPA: SDR family oxidoreductase [Solirubrobacteraceae bacterium]|jgi:NAD(P)-dependent dehydrogenase (short-subunit alcohol dehydrogenase family)
MSREIAARDPSISISKPPLEGRVAVVTGASRGIGAGIAARLLAAGARVLGVSRTRSPEGEAFAKGEAFVQREGKAFVQGEREESVQREGDGKAFVQIECDVTAPDAPQRVLAGALEAFGRVDALVNNAGVLFAGACWEQGDEQIDATLALNLTAPFRLSQALAAHWVERGAAGVLVNVCSVESQVAWSQPPHAAYAASKGGLLALTRALALELAEHGIRVVALGPGIVATEMTGAGARHDAIPLGHRLGTPAEMGDVVAFLLSDAASYVTGEIVYADGGYLLR